MREGVRGREKTDQELHARVVLQKSDQFTVSADLVLYVSHQGAQPRLTRSVGVTSHTALKQ